MIFSVFSGKASIKILLRRQKNAMTKDQRRNQALQVYKSGFSGVHLQLFVNNSFNWNKFSS